MEYQRGSAAPSATETLNESRPSFQQHLNTCSTSTLAHEPQRQSSELGSLSLPREKSDNSLPAKPSSQHENSTAASRIGSSDDSSSQPDVEKRGYAQLEHSNPGQGKDINLVDWDGSDDPDNPMNWPTSRKWAITLSLGMMTFSVTFASSVFSAATVPTAIQFGVSQEVMVLATSLFVLGFAWGPICWGPLSELYGRKVPLFGGYFCFFIFAIPVAVAENLQTIMVCRFFGGLFASAPLAIIGGTLADFFDPIDRGVAIAVFSSATFIGPAMGPVMGGFITMSHLGWRWTQWIELIMAVLFWTIGLFIYPESYAPVILQRRAKKLRYQTRNWAIHAAADEKEVDLREITEKYLLRPFIMLFLEPILVLITVYMALIYGILYLFFEVYPISFQEERGWNMGVGALPFISILVGVLCGALFISIMTRTRFQRKTKQAGTIIPEERLIPMIVGGALLPAGLFWFAWTSSPHITPWPQIIAGAPIGMGIMMIFMQGLNYIIDVYKTNANSGIAANTFARSWVGAGFPLFATGMYHNLGIPWATSLLGFLTAALFPVPIIFYIYGARIRKLSRYSPS
ncbi:MFS general substrate transporter [Polychaeton citri CBS 116435]|uniref:Cercosporin MFS transporter CTB4 n=1 Tax=Polychaeton citri CBS 116435 TaxID=1314669 RepID=A0A9P4UPZ2_9PEZI|nr:MFS general substrate transporter [Polychaeton citri CBS 116435]